MALSDTVDKSILNALREALLDRTPLQAIPETVWKRTGALNTWGTNAIEGNTLTWHDVEMLLLEGRTVADRPIADVLETMQHEAAFRGLLARLDAPIRITTALELHEAVFRGVKADAGQWRRVRVYITGSRHRPPSPEDVVPLMMKWEAEYSSRDLVGEPAFALGAWMHHAFESIHPFPDGNGRVGRLLLNLHLLKHSWPPLHILPPDKKRYIACMESAHESGPAELEGFLLEAMARSLLDLLDQVGTRKDELRPIKELAKDGAHSAKYLALRASQGELPAVKERGGWRTSERALGLYRDIVGRA
jgi:Fic family protein